MKKLYLSALVIVLIFSCVPPGEGTNEIHDSTNLDGTTDDARTVTTGTFPSKFDRTTTILTTVHYATINNGTVVDVGVDPDEVIIGGGAYIMSNTTAFLTASYPVIGYDENAGKNVIVAWRAQAKAFNNKRVALIVYAVGMKLMDWCQKFKPNTWIPRNEVLKYIQVRAAISNQTAHPTATAYAPEGYSIVSGGARVIDPFTTTPSSYLTGSYFNCSNWVPTSNQPAAGGWTASSKDHLESSPARIIAYAVCIPTNDHTDSSIPNFGDIRVLYNYCSRGGKLWEGSAVTEPNKTGIIYFNGFGNDWCTTGVGAYTEYTNGWGRMLRYLGFHQDNSRVFVADRDYGQEDFGTLHVQRIAIERDDNEE